MNLKRVLLGLALAMSLAGSTRAQISPPVPTLAYGIKVVATASLSVTTTSGRVALGTAAVTAWVTNEGLAPVCVALGDVTVVATCPGTPQVPSFNIAPGETKALGEGASTYIAGITASGTATLTIQTGYLLPALAP